MKFYLTRKWLTPLSVVGWWPLGVNLVRFSLLAVIRLSIVRLKDGDVLFESL